MVHRVPYSYKTHYWCHGCGWVEKETCIEKGCGYWCPTCNRRVRTRARQSYKAEKARKQRLSNKKG